MCFVKSKTLVVSKGKDFCLAFSAIEVLSFLTEIMFFFFLFLFQSFLPFLFLLYAFAFPFLFSFFPLQPIFSFYSF